MGAHDVGFEQGLARNIEHVLGDRRESYVGRSPTILHYRSKGRSTMLDGFSAWGNRVGGLEQALSQRRSNGRRCMY